MDIQEFMETLQTQSQNRELPPLDKDTSDNILKLAIHMTISSLQDVSFIDAAMLIRLGYRLHLEEQRQAIKEIYTSASP